MNFNNKIRHQMQRRRWQKKKKKKSNGVRATRYKKCCAC